jgi:UDP-N-acetylmuramoyl-L-alanyl-D-glutamate--2,6-diaminopimelate ligase
VSSWGSVEASVNQGGRFNVANALGVLGCLVAYGIPFPGSRATCSVCFPPCLGRMQRLGGDGRPLVIVDYAHTPDALDKTLQALRPVADARGGSLIAVFLVRAASALTKRAPMGAASRHADRVVLTSDNPRSEEPLVIIAAVRAGVTARASRSPTAPQRSKVRCALPARRRDPAGPTGHGTAGNRRSQAAVLRSRVRYRRSRAGPADDEPQRSGGQRECPSSARMPASAVFHR